MKKESEKAVRDWYDASVDIVDELFPKPKDQRAYLVAPLINAVMAGHDLTDDNRERLKEFPTLIKLLDRYAQIRINNPYKKNSTIHFSLGPEATVESLAQSQLDWLDHVEKYKKYGFEHGLSIEPVRFSEITFNRPTISAEVVGDKDKWAQFQAAVAVWEEWCNVEEKRRWRQAYTLCGEPVPEEFGISMPNDHIPFEQPEKVKIT